MFTKNFPSAPKNSKPCSSQLSSQFSWNFLQDQYTRFYLSSPERGGILFGSITVKFGYRLQNIFKSLGFWK